LEKGGIFKKENFMIAQPRKEIPDELKCLSVENRKIPIIVGNMAYDVYPMPKREAEQHFAAIKKVVDQLFPSGRDPFERVIRRISAQYSSKKMDEIPATAWGLLLEEEFTKNTTTVFDIIASPEITELFSALTGIPKNQLDELTIEQMIYAVYKILKSTIDSMPGDLKSDFQKLQKNERKTESMDEAIPGMGVLMNPEKIQNLVNMDSMKASARSTLDSLGKKSKDGTRKDAASPEDSVPHPALSQ
jgi:hypothetical protein